MRMPDFNYVRKGYDPGQVNQHIEMLERELSEYREKNSVITNAILNAQAAADEITRKAEIAAETIIKNARNLASTLAVNSSSQIQVIIDAVKNQRIQLRDFRADYLALINKYIHTLEDSDINRAEKKAVELEGYLQNFMDSELSVIGNKAAEEPRPRPIPENEMRALFPENKELAE